MFHAKSLDASRPSCRRARHRRADRPLAHAPQLAGHASSSAAPSKCPFALAASFMLAEPRPPKLSPLGEAASSVPPVAATAHLWLAADMPGQARATLFAELSAQTYLQDKPGRLVSGLRRLTHVEEFLNEETSVSGAQLALKRSALDSASRRSLCLACEPRSLPAQAECLEMLLDYLPKRYPQLYRVAGDGDARTISVATTGETHAVADFAACPLELCARIVQEDLVLMRASDLAPGEPEGPYVMSAAVVVFSFGDLHKKLSQPLAFLHAPVPGFEAELNKLLTKTFNGLAVDKPVWRNNWALVESGALDNPSYGTSEALAAISAPIAPKDRFLKTEYQTVRRLPSTGAVLFTIRTFVEPVEQKVLAIVPGAAASLARSLEGMTDIMRSYKGLKDSDAATQMLAHLHTLDARAAAGGAVATAR